MQQGLTYEGGRPREEDILTRRHDALWDRIKWLVLLAVIWLLLVWSLMADNPLIGFVDALRIEVQLGLWVFILFGLELVHQAHFLVSEHSAALQPVLDPEGLGPVGAAAGAQAVGRGPGTASAGLSAG